MSSFQDCEAIEKGLKDIIFGMSNGGAHVTSESSFPITIPKVERNCFLDPPGMKLPFTKLSDSDSLLNQENSSMLIDLNALTEFTNKHIVDEPIFKTPLNDIKLPHPEMEDTQTVLSSSTGVSELFEEIKNCPNVDDLPKNPLQVSNIPKKPVSQNIFPKKKRRKKKSNKSKDPAVSEDNKKTDVKLLEKESKDSKTEIKGIKSKKNLFSSIGKEYSIMFEQDCYKFNCHLCNFATERPNVITAHFSSKGHLSNKELSDKDMMLPFLPEPMPEQLDAITSFLTSLVTKKGLLPSHLEARNELSARFSKFVQEKIPGCAIYMVGSSVHGIGLQSSEVDFVLSVEHYDMIPDTLEALYFAVGKEEDSFENVIPEFKQMRPHVVFTDSSTKLHCRILIDYGSSFRMANLLAMYCKLDNRLQSLGTAVRYWAKLCEIDQQDHGTLPSISFALMVVYFLQQVQPPVLPALNEEKDFQSTFEFYEKYLKERRWKSQNTDSLGELWLKFFRFYTFEYKIGETVICIRTSKKVTCKERKWNTRFYAIEEPFMRRNIAYVIPSFRVCNFIQKCFLQTYRYYAYPQLKRGYPQIKLLKTEDFDALKLSEYLKSPPIKEDESGDSDASEIEDSASADLLNISHDLEDHDPEIRLEDLTATISHLQLDEGNESTNKEEDVTSDKDQSNNKTAKEPSSRQQTKVVKMPPVCVWDIEDREILPDLFGYHMDRNTVRGENGLPIDCSLCKKSGHVKKDCPIDDLPRVRPLPEMTPDHLNAITTALHVIFNENIVSEDYFKKVENDMLDIEASIKEVYPDAKLNLFGSFCNGFGFRNISDLDFCLTFAEHKDGKNFNNSEVINKIAKQLQSHPKLENVIAITGAKVPIVKFAWKESKLEGDISLYNTLALNNTKLLEAYSKIDSRVQILGYALKFFAKTLGICDASRGSLSSYAYILMVLYFLQQRDPPVIPVLQELYEGEKPVELIDDWNVWYYKDIDKLKDVWPDFRKNKESIAQLWMGLLCFYASEFDWKEYVVSIKQKSPLRRFKKLWMSGELAIEDNDKGTKKRKERRSSWMKLHLAIEDPFDLSHNLGGGLSRKMNSYILRTFIRCRERCGTPVPAERMMLMIHKKELGYFFNRNYLNSGCEPPHDRGCGNCGKIGHIRKDCPEEKTCSYCRKPGHLIRDCPRKPLFKEQGNSRERNRNNDDQRVSNEMQKVPTAMARNDVLAQAHQFPVMLPNPEAQKLLQIGIPIHRMPSQNFSRGFTKPPPGFKTNGPLLQTPNYPPAFNRPNLHVPPFPQRPVNRNEMLAQSPPKHFNSSPPKNGLMGNKPFGRHDPPPGWQTNHRPQPGFQVDRHPNPQALKGNSIIAWPNRLIGQSDNPHKPNQQRDRQNRTKPDRHSYNPSDRRPYPP